MRQATSGFTKGWHAGETGMPSKIAHNPFEHIRITSNISSFSILLIKQTSKHHRILLICPCSHRIVSTMGLIDFVGNNAAQIDAKEYEDEVRESDPKLLQHDEHLVFAFKGRGGKGRDHYMLTTKRVLVRDKKGMTGKRISYSSVPYTSIRAFSLETAGSVDDDKELKMYSRSIGKISIDLTKSVDVMPIHQFLSAAILRGEGAGEDAAGAIAHGGGAGASGGASGFLDVFGSDYAQVDKQEVEARLKNSPSVLLDDEKVEMAFKCGRDSFILTSHRVLKIDVQGVSGKKIEYLTILWPAIKGYSVETAGNILDRDSELTLFFNLPDTASTAEGFPRNSLTRMKIDFRQGQADLFAVQKYVSDKLLGADTVASSEYSGSMAGHHDTGSGSILAWAGDDNRMIDAVEANRYFHSDVPLLQNCENVELAFRGRRDMMLFTSKRMVFVDMQGFMGMGKKVEYISMPWKTVSAFSVRSAGSFADKDSEMCLWLDFDDVFYPRRANEDDPPPPPIPRKSFLEIDFQKDKVDILMVHRYLSERLLRENAHQLKPHTSPVAPDILVASPDAGKNLLDWIGEDAAAIDAEAVDEKFHEVGILQDDEHVAFAFKTGRDSLYFTNKRVFIIDVQGFSGKRKEYMSVPNDVIRSWSVESAGSFDRDMEVRLWFKGYWNNKIKQDLRKGKADIFAIQSHIAHFIIGDADGKAALANAQAYEPSSEGAMTKVLGFVNDAHMKDPVELTNQMRESPALLQQDESIDAAFKCGRDHFLITTKRIIVIDKKGMTGKSVEYKSYPLMYNKAFKIETEGSLLNGSEVKVYTDDDDIKQELAKGQKDNVWAIHEILSEKMLNHPQKEIGEIEINLA
mmetsp:Transcript_9616/g.20813  ORF Transcript_9616/g.20813 Transcript_9616/m.20813 type:complete len:857 (+) Transcript_9616:61-2631(+)